jgi:hypothetical protein
MPADATVRGPATVVVEWAARSCEPAAEQTSASGGPSQLKPKSVRWKIVNLNLPLSVYRGPKKKLPWETGVDAEKWTESLQ